jgi:hypothetical protein
MSDMLTSTAIDILLPSGTRILAEDEFYDNDFAKWEKVPQKLLGRPCGKKDIIKRATFNLGAIVSALVAHVEVLRDKPPDELWWNATEATLQEARRRLGIKTIYNYQRDD